MTDNTNKDDHPIANRLKRRRKQLRISQAGLAEETGLSQRLISAYEDRDPPGADRLRALSKSLAVSADWLLNGDNIPTYSQSLNDNERQIIDILHSLPQDAQQDFTALVVASYDLFLKFRQKKGAE